MHFDAAATCDPQVTAGVRAEPQDLCSVNSVITAQQAQQIGVTTDTAAKLSAFVNNAAERHAAATVISRTDPIGAFPELNRSLRLHTAGMRVACGHESLCSLASYYRQNERGVPLFSSSEIGRARARGVIRRPATSRDGPPRLPTEPARP